MTQQDAHCRIGTSGYQYPHWKARFYPDDIPKKQWFGYFAQHFDTVEINNTFYNLPGAETFDQWHDHAPQGFLYVLKYSRYGSHIKKLKDPDQHVPNFLDVARKLKSHLGPILVQLPPGWSFDPERLETFLSALPKDQRWALEFRNRSWLCDQTFELLRQHDAALCIHDMVEDHPRELTASWTYLRFHGPGPGGNYSHQALTAAADRVADYLNQQIDVYAYFNNDAEGYALDNAAKLKEYVASRTGRDL
jgi:uncharacterized protein YecE (DUF72 family)